MSRFHQEKDYKSFILGIVSFPLSTYLCIRHFIAFLVALVA